jgi:hypothetical protein
MVVAKCFIVPLPSIGSTSILLVVRPVTFGRGLLRSCGGTQADG